MSGKLALVLVGDVMLGRIVDESLTALPRQLHGGVWGDVLPLLQGGMAAGEGEEQLVAGNLECAVTVEEQKVGGRAHWLAAPAVLRAAPDSPEPEGGGGGESCQPGQEPTGLVAGSVGTTGSAGCAALQEEKAFNFKLHPRNVPALRCVCAAGRCSWRYTSGRSSALPAADPAPTQPQQNQGFSGSIDAGLHALLPCTGPPASTSSRWPTTTAWTMGRRGCWRRSGC